MKELTLFVYLILIVSWIYVLFISIKEINQKRNTNKLILILFTIILIDAVKTLIESAYFGTRLASQYGFLPEYLFAFLSNPTYLIIPKLINVIAALSIVFIIYRSWLPSKRIEELNLQKEYDKKLIREKELEKLNKDLEELVNQKTIELVGANLQLENRVKQEVQKNKDKENMLFIQSKNAAMGEMIRSIAHQWRQPLSTISIAASGAKFEKELEILTDEKLLESLDIIT